MARNFNGSGDMAVNTSVNYLTTGTPGTLYSFGGWVYPASTSAGTHQAVMISRPAIPAYFAQLRRDTSDWNYFHDAGVSSIQASFAGGVTANQWFHIFGTYDGSNIRLYVNGALKATTATNNLGPGAGSTEIQFGSDTSAGGSGSYWDGNMADMAIWTGSPVLTLAEISAMANGARPFQIRPSLLVGYWPLTGLQSPEPDLSGAAANLTLTGTLNAASPPLMQFTPRWPQRQADVAPTPGIELQNFNAFMGRRIAVIGY